MRNYLNILKETPLIEQIHCFIEETLIENEDRNYFFNNRGELVSILNNKEKPLNLEHIKFNFSTSVDNKTMKNDIKISLNDNNLSFILYFDFKLNFENNRIISNKKLLLLLDKLIVKKFCDDSLVIDCCISNDNWIKIHHHKNKENAFDFYNTILYFDNSQNQYIEYDYYIEQDKQDIYNFNDMETYKYGKKLIQYSDFFANLLKNKNHKKDEINTLYNLIYDKIFENKQINSSLELFSLTHDISFPEIDENFCFNVLDIFNKHFQLKYNDIKNNSIKKSYCK